MTLPANFKPKGLVPIVIISDKDGVEQYRYEHALALSDSVASISFNKPDASVGIGGGMGAPDGSGNGNHGTWVGNPKYANGRVGMAAEFDNVSYVTLANQANFQWDKDKPWTISGWFKVNVSGSNMIVSKGTQVNVGTGVYIFVNSVNNFVFQIMTDTAQINNISTGIGTISLDTWYHFVAGYDGSGTRQGMRLELNGVTYTGTSNTFAGTTISNATAVTIGAEGDGGVTLTGLAQYITCHDYMLTTTQSTNLYQSNTTPNAPTPEQDFPMQGYHLHGGIGADLGRLMITLDDRNNEWTDTTKGRRPSKFSPWWKIDMYMFLAEDAGNPNPNSTKANMDPSKLWFSGYVVDPQVLRPINNYQSQTLFGVGLAVELTERLTSMKLTQDRAADGVSLDTTAPLTASQILIDLLTKTYHFPHTGLTALTNFNTDGVTTTSDITFADFHVHYYTIHQAIQEVAGRAGYVWGVRPDGTVFMHPRGTLDSGLLFTNNIASSVTTNWNTSKLSILRNVPTGYTDSGAGTGYAFMHGVGGTTDFLLYEQTSSDASLNLSVDAEFAFPFIPTDDSVSRIALYGSRNIGTITAISQANPTEITDANHGLTTGETVTISGSDSTPSVDGDHIVTVTGANTFTIDVNVTVAGTTGSWVQKATTPLVVKILSDDGRSVPQTGSVKLTAGTTGQVSGITVAGVQIMSGAVVFDTDLETTGTKVADNINNYTSVPNYRAASYLDAAGDAVITIIPLEVHDWINTKTVASTVTGDFTKVDTNMAVATIGAPSYDLRRRIKLEPALINSKMPAAGGWLEYPLETLNSGTRLTPYQVHWVVVESHPAVRLDYETTYGTFARNTGSIDNKEWTHDAGALKVRIHHSHSVTVIVENTVAKKQFGTREVLLPISDFPNEEAALNGLIGFSEVTSRAMRVYQPIQATPPWRVPELGKTARMVDKFNGMDTTVDLIGYDIQATSFSKWNRGVDSMTFHVEEVYYPE